MCSFKQILKQDHRGIGGLYFIVTMMICSFILLTTVRLSWDSQAISMADNFAHITAINTAVYAYTENIDTLNGNYLGKLPPGDNKAYSPISDFTAMLQSAGIIQSGNKPDACRIVWDGKNCSIQYGKFKTTLGTYIRPHEQSSTIEDN